MSSVKPIAFYLPQYHPVEENSEWWGPGFTEWTNVARGKPNFVGHYQPHVPRELGFYDLRLIDNMRAQADLARLYGIEGFCFYYYWFNGRRILELPIDNYLKSDIDFPFCVCWANENWTRTWDGLEKDVLLEQKHGPDEDRRFLEDLVPLLKDPRAIRVDGKPILLVYRADLFPDSKQTVALWREVAREHGIGELHLVAVQFYGIVDPRDWGFDAAVEFPPHTFIGSENRVHRHLEMTNPHFRGGLVDYRKVIAQSIGRTKPDYRWYRAIVPSWDNTARRQHTSHIMVDSSPGLYGYWLKWLVRYTRANNAPEDQLIFINAWNEWGEGCHLEPDQEHGLAYLEETYAAVVNEDARLEALLADSDLLRAIGKERISRLLDEKDNLARDVVLLSAELRHRALNPGMPPVPQRSLLRRMAKKILRRFPPLYRLAVRVHLKWTR
ncbi:glycoside hydrolase family 99-like domain-containing protein [Rhodanobacter sp. MP7CTX1]|uniref:glycosyltransferase WbsX family protein n=1 Tax=Rhodanobacter sp. MP7CTX1 TaxID=2723084 RepID=UPI00161554BD|nr:glycoside hydrolase family 99-like domain-containing protein [Rhodanobacter sp. MP7CTX1]MBB6187494.1 lipopolysaccharide biosynthesis protein [Rhodanobacter sp. MP7CTX1]